jgi:energy-coupling factor transport system substrate-specific component
MTVKEAFRFKITTMGIVLIPVAIGINFVGKFIGNSLNLPAWLDSIGTILAAILAGPWIGAISGAVNNIFFSFFDGGISLWYAITSIAIAVVAGILSYAGWFRSLAKAILAGIVIAIVSAVISTPINVFLWEGQTGKTLGDLLYAYLIDNGFNIWIASFMDELVLDLIDKIIVALIVFVIVLGLPKSITQAMGSSAQTIRK